MIEQEARKLEIEQLTKILEQRKKEYEKNFNCTYDYAGLQYIENEYKTIGTDKNRV